MTLIADRPGSPPALHRDLVAIEPPTAATADDLFHRLSNQRPHVVHFSGQSSSTGLLLDGTDIHDPDGGSAWISGSPAASVGP
ncbi:hypothetical protein ABGB16_33280 [Micromonospora sp. B11E3]|uniref:hypothetical protein n=1 Tax=Micromonospora sp. B11E3 TaxID=3153562 RepID=UPI00325D4676